MAIKKLYALLLVISLPLFCISQTKESLSIQGKSYVASVGIIKRDSSTNDTAKFACIGSGLLVSVEINHAFAYLLITARHVGDYALKHSDFIYIRPSSKDSLSLYKYFGLAVPIKDSSKPMFCYYSDVDITCILINPEYIKLPKKQKKDFNFLSQINPVEFTQDSIYLVGYPRFTQNAALKTGFTIGPFNDHHLLIHCEAYPGNSGGPCFNNRNELTGILIAQSHGTDSTNYTQRQLQNILYNKTKYLEQVANIGIIVNTQTIIKLIEYNKNRISVSR